MFDIEIKNANRRKKRWGPSWCYKKIPKIEDDPFMKDLFEYKVEIQKRTQGVQTLAPSIPDTFQGCTALRIYESEGLEMSITDCSW